MGHDLHFLKDLVSSEKSNRESGLENFTQWLQEQTKDTVSEQDLAKVWKALFLSLWMQDKPLLQQSLSIQIAESIHLINDHQLTISFLRAFWITIVREWPGIDRHRMDKFYFQIKSIIRNTFMFLEQNGWNIDACHCLSEILQEVVFGFPLEHTPDSLKYFVSEYYLELLLEVIGTELKPSLTLILALFDPFFAVFSQSNKQTVCEKVKVLVLNPLLDHATLLNSPDTSNPALGIQFYKKYLENCKSSRKKLLQKLATAFGYAENKASSDECQLSFEPPTISAYLEMKRRRILPWFVQEITSTGSRNNDSPRIKWGTTITKQFCASSPVCEVSCEKAFESELL